jgi:hypothetical protein
MTYPLVAASFWVRDVASRRSTLSELSKRPRPTTGNVSEKRLYTV